jgi:signal transduction histidine kinase/CheY-like chemotaxis protein
MPSSIFKSKFTLEFKDNELEHRFTMLRYKNMRKNNIIFSITGLILAIFNSTMLTINDDGQAIHQYLSFNKTASYIILGIKTIILLLALFTKRYYIQQFIAWLNFYIVMYSNMYLRYYLSEILKADYIVFGLIFSVQHLYRLMMYFADLLGFVDGVFNHLAIIVSSYIYFGVQTNYQNHYKVSIYSLIFIISCLISYFYLMEKRKSFYYLNELEKKVVWHHGILENMNSGFVSITDMRIKYINETMFGYIMSNKNTFNISTLYPSFVDRKSKENLLNLPIDQCYFILKELFSNLNSKKTHDCPVDELNSIFDHLEEIESTSFIHLGTKELEVADKDKLSTISFEVYGRYFCNKGENNYEFIFNDVSKVRVVEEANAEFKYKSLFLSKVAHEFKNPLICIVELIDALMDKLNLESNTPQSLDSLSKFSSKTEILKESLVKIKSMSDYLIILVKDIDLFSQKEGGTGGDPLDKTLISLERVIKFCQDITKTLITRYEKDNVVAFQTVLGEGIPKILYSDEIKLKQVLINLLSNAVKYTPKGSVTFEIRNVEECVKFIIRDTGKGIPESNRPNLFTPFNKHNFKNNSLSAGLGLSIVKDLVNKLGSKIEFESELDKGSTFAFNIPIKLSQSSSDLVASIGGLSGSYGAGATKAISRRSKPGSYQSNHSSSTVVKDFHPWINNSIRNSYFFINVNNNNGSTAELNIKEECIQPPQENFIEVISNNEVLSILLVDDEMLSRKSTVRLLTKLFRQKDINVKIYEASDGVECLSYYYKYFSNEIEIDFILSDESMNLLSGVKCANIIQDLESQSGSKHVPFFILSAYDGMKIDSGIEKAFTKPLNKQDIEEMMTFIN